MRLSHPSVALCSYVGVTRLSSFIYPVALDGSATVTQFRDRGMALRLHVLGDSPLAPLPRSLHSPARFTPPFAPQSIAAKRSNAVLF